MATSGASSNHREGVLGILSTDEGLSVAQVAARADIGRSAAARHLARLEAEGKARRSACGRPGPGRDPDRWWLLAESSHMRRNRSSPTPGGSGGAN